MPGTTDSKPTPTVVPFSEFNEEHFCEGIRKATKGVGTKNDLLIWLLTQTSRAQRQQLHGQFKTMFGKDLNTLMKKELSGNFERLVLHLLDSEAGFYCTLVHKACKGLGTNEELLTAALLCCPTKLIPQVVQEFQVRYDKDIEKLVMSETSGHFKRFCVALLQGQRDETSEANLEKAKADAELLYKSGEKRFGTDESVFNRIFMSSSPKHLCAIAAAYRELSPNDLHHAIEKEMSGSLKMAFTMMLGLAVNPAKVFAKLLYKSMKGLGTDDTLLQAVVVARCEVDMADIKTEFRDLFGRTLAHMISKDTSGNYKNCLLSLIGEGKERKCDENGHYF
eukprot:m.46423 g.46423  ORF g.46423 m.46423 type:complete len:336 (+) comp17521_c1_seq1:40-1047(+)